MTPEAARKEAPATRRIGKPFQKGHHSGRPKGAQDRRRLAGILAAKALEARAWDVVESLLTGRSLRVRLEAAKVVLSYSIGLPKATLEVSGGLSDLAGELARALQAVRERRLALPAVVSGERSVNEKGEIPPPIEGMRHTTRMIEAIPALPAPVLEVSPIYLGDGRTSAGHLPPDVPEPSGAATPADMPGPGPVADVAVGASVAEALVAAGDPGDEPA